MEFKYSILIFVPADKIKNMENVCRCFFVGIASLLLLSTILDVISRNYESTISTNILKYLFNILNIVFVL